MALIEATIFAGEQAELDSPFTVDEIKKVVLECNTNKAHAHESFSVAFFQDNWEEIKEDFAWAEIKEDLCT